MPLILLLGGAAALGWQIVWSHHLGLALGTSARGVALTVATAMLGMALGAIVCARFLRGRRPFDPILLYGGLELAIGLSALIPGFSEGWIMSLDGEIHRRWPMAATPFTVIALAASIGPAGLAMGATIPAMGLIARNLGTPLSRLYAFNTAGAATGTLLAAFLLIPASGLRGTASILVLTHLGLALTCGFLALRKSRRESAAGREASPEQTDPDLSHSDRPADSRLAGSLVFLSGAAAFILEISWFRSLRSAWFSTSDSLAIMLFCFLIALALGAAAAPSWRRRGLPIWAAFAGGSVLVIIATSLLGRFDLAEAFQSRGAWRQISRVFAGLAVMGPPVALIGLALPTILDRVRRPRDWAALYAINTLGAVAGANLAAWLLLEHLGPSLTSWTAAGLLAAGACLAGGSRSVRVSVVAAFVFSLSAVWWVDRDERLRVPGAARMIGGPLEKIESRHGPDATISVLGFEGGRALFIDGFVTTAESTGSPDPRFQYMDAIGRLPMLLHPDPRDALVICFGTGQTAHAVRDEGPEHLDLADLNAAVFDLAHHFESNHEVLGDPRVRKVVMDGRAWLRRTEQTYDVVTLEPMPPFFSGSNALYSSEFYRLVDSRLRPGGFLAQWFPLHLMTPDQAGSIAASFLEAFPDAILWMDPRSIHPAGLPDQCILVGRRPPEAGTESDRFWEEWPGYARLPQSGRRTLPAFDAKRQVVLDPDGLRRFAADSVPVTDDNRLLEYGPSPYREGRTRVAESIRQIHARIAAARSESNP